MPDNSFTINVPEDLNQLVTLKNACDLESVINALKQDKVVLTQNVAADAADQLMFNICDKLGLSAGLELQAGFASSLGHRENVGKYFMTVNKRNHYEFISPHSEGTRFSNMQLAAFYCYENTTDGGDTILMKVNQACKAWQTLREVVKRGKSSRALTRAEMREIKAMARISMPKDKLKPDDEILESKPFNAHFDVITALAKPIKTHSQLLDSELFSFWDTIDSIDHDSAMQFYIYLKERNMLRLPSEGLDITALDDGSHRRKKKLGANYQDLFSCQITRKLKPGDFIIQNNLSWTHAVSNWTPDSGIRKVVAAFA